MKQPNLSVEDFYVFKIKNMWTYFKGQHFAFKMICCYLFVEFVRPQSIFPVLDFLPWAFIFIIMSMVGAFLDSSVKWTSSFANVLMIIFSLLIISATFVTPLYPDVARKYFMDFFNWVIIYFLIINIVNTKERFYIFAMIFLIAAAKIAMGTSRSWVMRGFSFTSWGLMGPSGYFQNSGELAILMLVLFPFAYYFYQATKEKVGKWERLLLMAFWVCPILTILGASSRGAQLALVAQLIFMFRASIFKLKPLIGVILLSAAIFFLLPQEQKDRFSKSGDDKTSQQRLLYWGHGWDMMKNYPLTGVGMYNFIPYYEQHFPEDTIETYQGKGKAELPHNIFIQVGTDAGFLAVTFFIFIILYCFKLSYSLRRSQNIPPPLVAIAVGLGFGVFGFLVAGQFVTVGYYPFLWINLAFLVALGNVNKKCSQARSGSAHA